MTKHTYKIVALSLLPIAANLGAAPSVYPTGVTRYDTAAAYNSYVIFSGQDKKTHLIDMNGNEVHSWNAEGFPPVLLDPALTGGQRGNVLVQLASVAGTSNEGNGLRNQAIGELDWHGNVVWQWGAAASAQDAYAAPVEGKANAQVRGLRVLPRSVDQIIGQHDAHLIEPGLPGAGNILVFDNQGEAGYPRVSVGVQPRSRVLEIHPIKKHIVWEYTGGDSNGPEWGFYSSFISSASRLPNGNTLIDEGMNGRIFQVTHKGDIAWEYISPYFAPTPVAGAGKPVLSNWLYRAQPVPYNWVPEGTPRSEKAVTPPEPGKFRVATN